MRKILFFLTCFAAMFSSCGIPALPGSSGSAVVNHKGQLVAINYAGISSTQSFNYGIRVKYLIKLLKGVGSSDSDDEFE